MRFLLLRPLCTAAAKVKTLYGPYRSRALVDARLVVTDYLHSTRSLPFSHADLIAAHSPLSLSALLSSIPFPRYLPPSDLPRALRRFLSYHPLNEFDFLFESIGLPPDPYHPPDPYQPHPLFLSDDAALLAALSALVTFGFPWTRLGLLYSADPAIFHTSPSALLTRLLSLEALGLPRTCVIAACLTFPFALTADHNLLFDDLTNVFIQLGLSDKENNADYFFQICNRIKVFYNMGLTKGSISELTKVSAKLFLKAEETMLAKKLKIFISLGMEREDACLFVLRYYESIDFDMQNQIAMLQYLRQIELAEEEVVLLSYRYPYIMGKNRLGNLSGVMRALDVNRWFVSKIAGGDLRYLSLAFTAIGCFDGEMEDMFMKDLERIKSVKGSERTDCKLEFLLNIGFGENRMTSRAVDQLKSTREQLEERFDCLLGLGIEYPMLCRMISAIPRILNQSTEVLKEKVSYLCGDLGYSLEYLDCFPAFLTFDLENRIKLRYNMLNWLKEKGLFKRHLSPATVLATSEKKFIEKLYSIHPAAPKQWLEIFSAIRDHKGNPRVLFLPNH